MAILACGSVFSLKSEMVSEIAIYSSLLVMFDIRAAKGLVARYRRFGRKSMTYKTIARDRMAWYIRPMISRIGG